MIFISQISNNMNTNIEFRNTGKQALSTVLNDKKNIDILEKHLYNFTIQKNENEENIIDEYNLYIYQVIGDILKEEKLKNILENIKKNKIGWEHTCFSEMANSIAEQNDFIQNPFQVEEGVFTCKNCGSKRVYSYTKQDRSGDESTSVYAQCVACKTKWSIRN